MINVNTLNELNKYGIGADINRLESFVIDCKQARIFSDIDNLEQTYMKLSKILKEIKPESMTFTSKTSIEESHAEKFDKLFIKYRNIKPKILYGTKDKNIDKLISYMHTRNDNCVDMMAIPSIQGINIKCTYLSGYIYRVNIIGEECKYTDITKQIKPLIPNEVEQFKEFSLVECRGKITIFNNQPELQNSGIDLTCNVMHMLRLGINIDKLSVVFDDLFIDNENESDIPFDNQWDKIEYLRELGFNIPHHALIRNVEEENIGQALESFRDYFDNIVNTTGIIYKYNGYEIRDNETLSYILDYSKFVYIYDNVDYRQIYSSKVKSIVTSNSNEVSIILKIVSVECNDKLTVNEIHVHDINILDTYDIKIGCRIYFKINNHNAELIENNNRV